MRGPKTKAAIAIRDHVPDYQKLFTMQFTVPRLREAYDTYWYFTATADDSKRDEFLAALEEATTEYRAVDVFLLAHGNRYIDWVATLPAEQRARIRLVYDTGCGDDRQAPEWLALGVASFVGHGDDNVAPVFYVSFLPAWLAGRSLEESVELSNAALRQRLFSPWGRALFQDGSSADLERLYQRTRGTSFRRLPLHLQPAVHTSAGVEPHQWQET